jgi:hypothetical protein
MLVCVRESGRILRGTQMKRGELSHGNTHEAQATHAASRTTTDRIGYAASHAIVSTRHVPNSPCLPTVALTAWRQAAACWLTVP